MYLNTLACLMSLRGEPERSLVYGERMLHLDPLREEIHREMMRLYLESGVKDSWHLEALSCCVAKPSLFSG